VKPSWTSAANSTSPPLRWPVSYVSDVIDNHHGPVTAALTALAFCDTQGLAALVRMANHAKHKDRPFQIASPRPSLVKIMRITGLDRRFLTPKR
jgi:anti-sigma B factor antagonist